MNEKCGYLRNILRQVWWRKYPDRRQNLTWRIRDARSDSFLRQGFFAENVEI